MEERLHDLFSLTRFSKGMIFCIRPLLTKHKGREEDKVSVERHYASVTFILLGFVLFLFYFSSSSRRGKRENPAIKRPEIVFRHRPGEKFDNFVHSCVFLVRAIWATGESVWLSQQPRDAHLFPPA